MNHRELLRLLRGPMPELWELLDLVVLPSVFDRTKVLPIAVTQTSWMLRDTLDPEKL